MLYAADPRYAASVRNLGQVSLSGDGVFGDNTAKQITAMTLAMSGNAVAGFTGTGTIGIATA